MQTLALSPTPNLLVDVGRLHAEDDVARLRGVGLGVRGWGWG